MPSPSPRLSVVMPLFNCRQLTQAAVAGLLATLPSDPAYEIILVDDGSTDGTRAWLATLPPPFRVVLNAGNLGYGAANNRGAALAQGELLLLLNNDLMFSPGWLEPMLAAHRSLGPRAGLVGNVQRNLRTGAVDHAGILINGQGKPEHDRREPSAWSRRLFPVRPVPAVTGACVVVASALWRELGGFDEGYRNGGEDVDLCFRAAEAGRTNAVALRSIVGHHVSASPGRKQRDEANSYRLARRWRATLVRLGARAWCRRYLGVDPRDYPDRLLACQCLGYLLGLRAAPPAGAVAGMQAALELELQRWEQLLGGSER